MEVGWSTANIIEPEVPLHDLCGLQLKMEDGERKNIGESGAVVEIKKLLEAGEEVNTRDNYHRTPLHFLAYHIKASPEFILEVISSLLEAGANPTLKDPWGHTPFNLMPVRMSRDLISAMILALPKRHPITSILDVRGGTLLHTATRSGWGGRVPLVKRLVDAGLGVNVTDNCGRTPLHAACYPRCGKLLSTMAVWDADVVSALLELGADVMATDNAGRIPLHYLFIYPNYSGSDNIAVINFHYSDYPDDEAPIAITKLMLHKNRSCLNFEDKNGRSPFFYSIFWPTISKYLSVENNSKKQVEDFGMLQEKLHTNMGLTVCFYSNPQKLLCPFPNLQFRTQGRIQDNKVELREWSVKTRERYTDPDTLVTRIFSTPAIGPPSLLQETTDVRIQVEKLFTRLIAETRGIYPSKEEVELVGSCREGTKTSLPDEFDFRVKVTLPQQYRADVTYHKTDDWGNDLYYIDLISNDEGDGEDIRKLTINFVDIILRALSERPIWEGLSVCLRGVEWGNKSFKLALEWTGDSLFEMCISVCLDLVFCIQGDKVSYIPHPENPNHIPGPVLAELTTRGWSVLCTHEWKTQLSLSDLDYQIFGNFPDVIRNGYILAKAMTRAVLTPEWVDSDKHSYKPTSYLLKLCLYDLLDPDRTYFLLDPHKCSTNLGSPPGTVRDWTVRIYQNLLQQLNSYQAVYNIERSFRLCPNENRSGEAGRVRCYFMRNTTLVLDRSHVICFCDAILLLLQDTHVTSSPGKVAEPQETAQLTQLTSVAATSSKAGAVNTNSQASKKAQ